MAEILYVLASELGFTSKRYDYDSPLLYMFLRIVLLALFIVAFKYHHTHAGLFLFVFTIFYHIYTEGEGNPQRAYST